MLDNSADPALAWFATGLTRVAEVPVDTAYKGEFSSHVVWDEVRAHQVTYTLLLGAMARMLLSRPERPDDADTPLEIRCVVPLPPDLDLFRRRFGVRPATVFGMTEVGSPIVAPAGSVVAGGAGRGTSE